MSTSENNISGVSGHEYFSQIQTGDSETAAVDEKIRKRKAEEMKKKKCLSEMELCRGGEREGVWVALCRISYPVMLYFAC